MALTVGENSYATAQEAATYFETRAASPWTDAALMVASDEALLVTATQIIDTLLFTGTRADSEQALAFPRTGVYSRDGNSINYPAAIPSAVKYATFEMAAHILLNESVVNAASTNDALSVGDVSLSGIKGVAAVPSIVYSLLQPYLRGGQRLVRYW